MRPAIIAGMSVNRRHPFFVVAKQYPRPNATLWIDRVARHCSVQNHPANPWLPLTTIEGFLVVGHFEENPPECEIPDALLIKVKIRKRDYETNLPRCQEVLERFKNDKPNLKEYFTKFCGGIDAAQVRPEKHGISFIHKHDLNPHMAGYSDPEAYLKSDRKKWLHDAFRLKLPIIPAEELRVNELPTNRLSETIISKFKAFCYEAEPNSLYIVLPVGTNATEFKSLVRSEQKTHTDLHLAFGDPDLLNQFLDNRALSGFENIESETRIQPSDTGVLICEPSLGKINKIPDDAMEVLQWALSRCIQVAGTDVHIDPTDAETGTIRIRINGVLRVMGTIPIGLLRSVISICKGLCKKNGFERNKPVDGKFPIKCGDREAQVRLSTIPTEILGSNQNMEAMALRILGVVNIPSLDALGVTQRQLEQLRWVSSRDNGLFLVTGPTGHGKTTTLNCMAREISTQEIVTLTIEDPVEVPIPYAKQSQVNDHPEINYDFKTALKSFLRQDPDFMMIGEVRDEETAEFVIQASLTGHLVFATLHTNSALHSINRLENLGIDRTLIGDSLIGVQAQRLIRTLCTCKIQQKAPENQVEYVKRYCERVEKKLTANPECQDAHHLINGLRQWLEDGITYRADGCTSCNGTGYSRRKAVMEIYLFKGNQEVEDMLMSGATIPEMRKWFASNGHLDIPANMIRMFSLHDTSFDEIKGYIPLIGAL